MNAWNILRNLWYAGNYWARWSIIVVVLWPIPVVLAALIGWPFLTATVALLPLLAIAFGLIAVFDPLVLAAIGTFALGRKFLSTLAIVVGSELAVGVFFAAVPVANDRGLIPLALLVMVAIVFFLLSGTKGKIVSVLTMVLVGIAIVSFMGGRDEIGKKVSATTRTVGNSFPVCADTESGVELTPAKAEAKLQLSDKCWSGWVSLPNNVDFRVNNGTGNDLEYLFWNGQRKFVSAKDRQWFGQINGNNFRLRGGGVAVISIEPKKATAPKLAPKAEPAPEAAPPAPPVSRETPAMPTLPRARTSVVA